MDDASLSLGALLRAARRRGELSQRELAAAAGVGRTTVARLEGAADSDARWSTVVSLLAAADCAVVLTDGAGKAVSALEHERVRNAGGRHYPAHLNVRRVRHPWRDWAQGPRYGTYATIPAPPWSYRTRATEPRYAAWLAWWEPRDRQRRARLALLQARRRAQAEAESACGTDDEDYADE